MCSGTLGRGRVTFGSAPCIAAISDADRSSLAIVVFWSIGISALASGIKRLSICALFETTTSPIEFVCLHDDADFICRTFTSFVGVARFGTDSISGIRVCADQGRFAAAFGITGIAFGSGSWGCIDAREVYADIRSFAAVIVRIFGSAVVAGMAFVVHGQAFEDAVSFFGIALIKGHTFVVSCALIGCEGGITWFDASIDKSEFEAEVSAGTRGFLWITIQTLQSAADALVGLVGVDNYALFGGGTTTSGRIASVDTGFIPAMQTGFTGMVSGVIGVGQFAGIAFFAGGIARQPADSVIAWRVLGAEMPLWFGGVISAA